MMTSPLRHARAGRLAAALALIVTPALVVAQNSPGSPASPGYESDTAGYRGLDAESGGSIGAAPAADSADRPSMPSGMRMEAPSEPAGAESRARTALPDVEIAPVPAPVRKLRESTEPRRGTEPGSASIAPESAPRPGFEYESVFDAYDMFEEREEPDWVGANDNVGKIGGWKTYAREIYESASGDALNDDAESGEGEDE